MRDPVPVHPEEQTVLPSSSGAQWKSPERHLAFLLFLFGMRPGIELLHTLEFLSVKAELAINVCGYWQLYL